MLLSLRTLNFFDGVNSVKAMPFAHPKKDIPIGTLKSIERQSGIKFKQVTNMANYIAVVHKDPKSDFGVSFPDFPGCVTAGSTIDEAKDMAHDALSLHIKGMLEDGDNIPTPAKLEDIMDDPDFSDAAAILVVSVSEAKPREQKPRGGGGGFRGGDRGGDRGGRGGNNRY